jgi:hypothetical protein
MRDAIETFNPAIFSILSDCRSQRCSGLLVVQCWPSATCFFNLTAFYPFQPSDFNESCVIDRSLDKQRLISAAPIRFSPVLLVPVLLPSI